MSGLSLPLDALCRPESRRWCGRAQVLRRPSNRRRPADATKRARCASVSDCKLFRHVSGTVSSSTTAGLVRPRRSTQDTTAISAQARFARQRATSRLSHAQWKKRRRFDPRANDESVARPRAVASVSSYSKERSSFRASSAPAKFARSLSACSSALRAAALSPACEQANPRW
jgi:hypothetical protein